MRTNLTINFLYVLSTGAYVNTHLGIPRPQKGMSPTMTDGWNEDLSRTFCQIRTFAVNFPASLANAESTHPKEGLRVALLFQQVHPRNVAL